MGGRIAPVENHWARRQSLNLNPEGLLNEGGNGYTSSPAVKGEGRNRKTSVSKRGLKVEDI
jgi:hypothetical protein